MDHVSSCRPLLIVGQPMRGTYRGLYGPEPDRSISRRRLWSGHMAAVAALWGARLLPRHHGLRTLAGEERTIVSLAQAGIAFALRAPPRLPRAYRLVRSDPVPGCTDLATLVFADPAGRGFTLSQRRAWLPLAQELAIARVPFTSIGLSGHAFHVVHGAHGGEPIDHSFWPATRRSLTFEADGFVVDLREIIGQGPGL